ncbi:MAG TPA: hypothetical protein VMT46_17785 [Anaerolineaceae bacterium]|nr:hypothetical protein [Anaerolineaceae bacterium]
MSSQPSEAKSPYAGPRPYSQGEELFGRDLEASELTYLLLAERIVLLYSSSGAGKSSLINAKIIPALEQQHFRVCLIRLSLSPPEELRGLPGMNRFVYATIQSIEQSLRPEDRQTNQETLARMRLNEYVTRRSEDGTIFTSFSQESLQPVSHTAVTRETAAARGRKDGNGSEPGPTGDPGLSASPRSGRLSSGPGRPQRLALIFDQFEEVLTLDPFDVERKEEFFNQVGETFEDPNRWGLFAMREDYLAAIEPYKDIIPTRLKNTFRLGLLDEKKAREAIIRPAPNMYEPEAVTELINNLRSVSIQTPSGEWIEQPGPYVEPVQLQVVCTRLWSIMNTTGRKISVQDVDDAGDVNIALLGYFNEKVSEIAKTTWIPERSIRDWIEQSLITEHGIRRQAALGSEREAGLDPRVIDLLSSAYLVRTEIRRGITWVELSHDRFISPILQSNAEWRKENLSLLQKQARVWDEHPDRPKTLLLIGQELKEAQAWEQAHSKELTPVERTFLEESIAEQKSINRRRLLTGLAIAVLVITVLVVSLFKVQADEARNVAEEQKQEADTARALADQNRLQAVESEKKAKDSQRKAEESQKIAEDQKKVNHLGKVINEAEILSADSADLAMLLTLQAGKFADDIPDGQTVSQDAYQKGNLLLSNGNRLENYFRGHQPGTFVNSVLFLPDGNTLISAGADGQIIFWYLGSFHPFIDGEPIRTDGYIYSATASNQADTPLLAAGFDYKNTTDTTRVWDYKTRKPSGGDLFGPDGKPFSARALAFNTDASLLAGGSASGEICLWNMKTHDPHCIFLGNTGSRIWSLKFNPVDRNMLATGDQAGNIKLWKVNLSTAVQLKPDLLNPDETPSQGQALSIDFNPEGTLLAAGRGERIVQVWDIKTKKEISGSPLTGHSQWVIAVAFSKVGNLLAAGGGDGTILTWDTQTWKPHGTPIIGYFGYILNLAFDDPGNYLAVGQSDGSVRFLDAQESFQNRLAYLADSNHIIDASAIRPDGKWLAMIREKKLIFYDLNHGLFAGPGLEVANQNVYDMNFSEDGKYLYTIGYADEKFSTSEIQRWKVDDSGQPVAQPDGHPVHLDTLLQFPIADQTNHRMISRDLTHLNQLILWDGPGAAPEPFTFNREVNIDEMVVSPDGKLLFIGEGDLGYIMNLPEISRKCDISGHTNKIWDAVYSPDGLWLATVSGDMRVRLWDTRTCDERTNWFPSMHHTTIYKIAASPSGRYLASLDRNGLLVLWDVQGGREAAEFQTGIQANVNTKLAFTPDERSITTFDYDFNRPDVLGNGIVSQWPIQFVTHLDKAGLQQALCYRAGRNLTQEEWDRYFPDYPRVETCPDMEILSTFSQADQAAQSGRKDVAAGLFTSLASSHTTDTNILNDICWFGSLDGYAGQVLDLCRLSVSLTPDKDKANAQDTLAVALAMAGRPHFQEAIDNFQAMISWARQKSIEIPEYQNIIHKRQRWIDMLTKGQNPFGDPAMLKKLRYESVYDTQ